MKHYLVLFILFCLYSICSLGQNWEGNLQDLHNEFRMLRARDNMYEKIEGTPYLNNDFLNGSLITSDSLIIKDVQLRYNIYLDQMEALLSGSADPRVVTSPRSFLYFQFNNRTFIYTSFLENNNPKQGYFELANRGKHQVLIRRNITYREAEEARGFSDPKPPRFIKRPDIYYIRYDRGLPEEIRLNRRNVLSAFDSNRDEIEDFVKNNNLSYRNGDDLVRIVEYHNQLLEKSNN